jgi:hypothetical protein
MTRDHSTEEPCAAKVACTVLKTSGRGDPLAECNRALRFAVLLRKIMQGTYNEKGDRWVERILSLQETCRLRGIPTFPILAEAVTCYFNGQHPDVSWI